MLSNILEVANTLASNFVETSHHLYKIETIVNNRYSIKSHSTTLLVVKRIWDQSKTANLIWGIKLFTGLDTLKRKPS